MDLQQLLRWSIQLQALDDGPKQQASTELAESIKKREPLDPKWIEIILGKGDFVKMKELLAALVDEQKSVADRVRAAEELEFLVEDVDNSWDFVKAKLAADLIPLLRHREADLRLHALWLFGLLCQNHVRVQRQFLADGYLVVVMPLLRDHDEPVRAKCIFFLNSFVRNFPDGSRQFTALSGHALLRRVLLGGDEKGDTPASPSLAHKILHFWSMLDYAQDAGMVKWFVGATTPQDFITISQRYTDDEQCSAAVWRLLAALRRHGYPAPSDEPHRTAIRQAVAQALKTHGLGLLSPEDIQALK